MPAGAFPVHASGRLPIASPPEFLVIGTPALRARLETLHQRIAAQFHDTVEIGAVSKDLERPAE
jgi:hypothetical protein